MANRFQVLFRKGSSGIHTQTDFCFTIKDTNTYLFVSHLVKGDSENPRTVSLVGFYHCKPRISATLNSDRSMNIKVEGDYPVFIIGTHNFLTPLSEFTLPSYSKLTVFITGFDSVDDTVKIFQLTFESFGNKVEVTLE